MRNVELRWRVVVPIAVSLVLASPGADAQTTAVQATAAPASAETGAALAEPKKGGPRIVLVTNHADARIMPLLKAELEGLGLTIIVVDKGPNEILPDHLKQAARAHDAVAAFRVKVASGEVEIWIADRVTGKVVLREVLTQSTGAKSEEIEIVLRAVELLRVSLMELEAPHEPRGEIEAPPELAKVVGFPESKQRMWANVGAGALWFATDLPLVPAVGFALGARLVGPLTLDAFGVLALAESTVEDAAGSAAANPRVLGLTLRYAPLSASWHPSVGLGGGLFWVSLDGQGEPPRPSYDDELYSPIVVADAALAYSISGNLRLRIGANGGYAFRRSLIVIDDANAARTSNLVASATLGLEAAWP